MKTDGKQLIDLFKTRSVNASRTFARSLTLRRRFSGADPLGFLSTQFGRRFGWVNSRLRAGERVLKQPGWFSRNTTIRSVTDLFMSFKSNHFVQHLRFLLNEIRRKDNAAQSETSRIERVTLSRSDNRHELQSASFKAVSMVCLVQQPRSDYFQAITHSARSQLNLTAATTQQFQSETFAPLFALRNTQRKSDHHDSYLASLQQSITVAGRITNTDRQTIVYAMGALSSAHKFTPLLLPQEKVDRQVLCLKSQKSELETVSTIYDSRWVRSFSTAVTMSVAARLRSFSTAVTMSVAARLRTHPLSQVVLTVSHGSPRVSRPSQPVITFSSDTKRIDPQRFQKTFVTFSSMQASHERLMNRSESRFVSNDSEISKFISRYQTIETDRSRQEVTERIFARRESARPLPSNDFVFAQTRRQEVVDERVVKSVEAREIVEIVRKELKESMNAVTPLWNFTRRDYEEIGDQVYSSLLRRLTVERERLGLT
jgi:hypothetical protein